MTKSVLVTGAGGFIGYHLVKRLRDEGCYVVGVDLKHPEFSNTAAQDFLMADLRNSAEVKTVFKRRFDEVYALAANMGGMGFIHTAECDIMHNSALININTIDAAARTGVPRYFFSSSVCVYRDMAVDEKPLTEDDAVPANPDNEYGWEKLYSERVLQAYSRRLGMKARIARFENCYGPLGTWQGGREKAPAALCRKIAEAKDVDTIDVWGDGSAVRVFTFVSDIVEGIITLARSELAGPVNIGCTERITVNQLAEIIIAISGKTIKVNHISGPVGVHSRNFSKSRIESLGWKPKVSIREGLTVTYSWIADQVRSRRMLSHE